MKSDVSPYLQRPVRKLEEVMAEAAQQRPELPPAAPAVGEQKPEASPPPRDHRIGRSRL